MNYPYLDAMRSRFATVPETGGDKTAISNLKLHNALIRTLQKGKKPLDTIRNQLQSMVSSRGMAETAAYRANNFPAMRYHLEHYAPNPGMYLDYMNNFFPHSVTSAKRIPADLYAGMQRYF